MTLGPDDEEFIMNSFGKRKEMIRSLQKRAITPAALATVPTHAAHVKGEVAPVTVNNRCDFDRLFQAMSNPFSNWSCLPHFRRRAGAHVLNAQLFLSAESVC